MIAGRVSEVAGKYRPEGPENAFKIGMKGEPSVLFPVKSGKRRNPRGFILRGPCIPLRRDYEPWAREVMDYINDNPQPFSFQKHPDTSKRTMEAASSYISKVWNGYIHIITDLLETKLLMEKESFHMKKYQQDGSHSLICV